ncbi:hydroxyquinol 1,2-dioxygenase [Cupriavidus lacunae]|uniref:Hydroxyquinol 1,2-dioxygenase n=1 Tax=Cupriavidus lacunae TaxID=2666307 RepID=A0A370P242_9BURK|nr:hydroxyquinol 1,2-dioxygenase [Cupriavidus lacunae]RDK11913.1 hydroxyquinol 1,2-dioxygenase [Cupriavidus lacunae]
MTKNFVKHCVLAIALAAAAAGAQASVLDSRSQYTDGARSVQDARDTFSEGARPVTDPHDPYTDGSRAVQDQRTPYFDGSRGLDLTFGAHTVAGLDRTGVSAKPARSVEPYLDGPRT